MIDRSSLNRRYADIFTEQENWKGVWQDLSNYILPRRGNFTEEQPNQGKRRDQYVLDGTPTRAARVLAAGMQSGLTSPARPWFKLGVSDPSLSQMNEVRMYLEEVQSRMMAVFSRSNIYNALHSMYEEIGVFGTASMILLEDFEQVIRARPFTIGEYALATASDLRVNVFARILWMTVAQVVQEFGYTGKKGKDQKPIIDWSNISDSVKNAYENGNLSTWIKIRHIIEPNDERMPDLPDAKNMPYRSIYWEEGGDAEKYLRISGYHEFPVMAPRWDAVGSDCYGKSPGWDALGDSKQLQKMEEDKLIALDKEVNPPMDVPASMRRYGVNVLPGGINWRDDANPQNGIRPAYQIKPDMQGLAVIINDKRQSIRETFYSDLFLMLAQSDRRMMTAREVVERHEEKLLMLGPVLERLESELLDPLIERTYSIMERNGLLPEPPRALQGMDLKVEYISMLAQAQKMVGTTSIEQVAGFVGNLAAVNPSVLDKIDFDEAVDLYADMVGVPPAMIRSDDAVAAIRDQKAKQQQQMMQAQYAMTAAQGAKTLSEADTGSNNALTALMGGPKV